LSYTEKNLDPYNELNKNLPVLERICKISNELTAYVTAKKEPYQVM